MTNKAGLAALVAALVAFASIANAADDPGPAALSPAQEEQANRLAEATGLAIYRHDRAAANATDALVTLRAFRDDKRVTGWITEEQGSAIVVTFVGAPAGQPSAALYRVTTGDDGAVLGEPVALEEPVPLTADEAAAAAARESASTSGFKPCSAKYNTVVLPLDDGASRHWVVYLLPGTTDAAVVPVGGTYRVELQPDGRTIVSTRPFTRSCIVLPKDPKAVALTITHLLDATPTEAHVFWSLWSGIPFYVMTPPNGTVWTIEKGRIRLVERGEKTG